MYGRIMVPLDGSELSLSALPHARHVSGPDTEVVLLQVVPRPETYFAPHGLDTEELMESQRRAAREFLENKQATLSEQGYKVRVVIIAGSPAHGIVDTAAREEVELIVLSSHGRSGLSRFLFGSVAQKVLSTALCPVLVVRQRR